MSGLVNKVKVAVADLTHNNKTADTTGTTAGSMSGTAPHLSTHHTATTAGTTGTGLIGTTGSTNAGPHGTNIANALDPRVDSDMDGSRNAGMKQTTSTTSYDPTTATGLAGPSTFGSSNDAGITHMSSTGHRTGTGLDGTACAGTPAGFTNDGPYNSKLAGSRSADMNPTINPAGHDSTTSPSTGLTSNVASATGPAPTTAGPHKSDVLNKLDPRVDSDLDGSKTTGGNKPSDSLSGTY